jgi:hypothetical protein
MRTLRSFRHSREPAIRVEALVQRRVLVVVFEFTETEPQPRARGQASCTSLEGLVTFRVQKPSLRMSQVLAAYRSPICQLGW